MAGLPALATPMGASVPSDEFETAQLYMPQPRVAEGAHVPNMERYRALYAQSIADPAGFWATQARENLTWFRDFKEVMGGGFEQGDVRWFADGQLNVCYNCIDR